MKIGFIIEKNGQIFNGLELERFGNIIENFCGEKDSYIFFQGNDLNNSEYLLERLEEYNDSYILLLKNKIIKIITYQDFDVVKRLLSDFSTLPSYETLNYLIREN